MPDSLQTRRNTWLVGYLQARLAARASLIGVPVVEVLEAAFTDEDVRSLFWLSRLEGIQELVNTCRRLEELGMIVIEQLQGGPEVLRFPEDEA